MLNHLHPTPKKPDRVVLLGGNGFIGQRLSRLLHDDGVDALILGSKDVDLAIAESVDKLEMILRPTDTVILLSAITPDKGRDQGSFMKNLLMTKHLVEALKKKPVDHLVYFSSDAVYGQSQSYVSEESPVAPQDLYGVMHLSRELMLSELKNIPLAILRVTMVYGAGDTHASYGPNRFFKLANKSSRIDLFGSGEEMRDHVHVNDVAGIAKSCVYMKSSGLLNVATGNSNSFKRVAELVAGQFEGGVEICENPRMNPITYRHYDVTNLLKSFPSKSMTKLEDGIRSYQKTKVL